jgi:undecaprenyl-diphosphatase
VGYRLVRGLPHAPATDRAARLFTQAGQHAACWLVLGGVRTALTKDSCQRRAWAGATARVAGAYVLNQAIKVAVRRPRPRVDGLGPLVGTPTQLSFPSAHATSSFAAARLYSRLGMPAAPLYAIAAALTFSRLYLGVHYPSDVIAGATLGTVIAR